MKDNKFITIISVVITICAGMISVITYLGNKFIFNDELFQIVIAFFLSIFVGVMLSFYSYARRPRKSTFVLYSNKDDFAKDIIHQLHTEGIGHVKTMDDIHLGDNVEEKLLDLITDADYIIVIISKDGVTDKLLLNSIKNASEEKKVILPLISDAVEEDKIPEEIINLKSFTYIENHMDVDNAVYEIMTAIREQRRNT